METTTLDDLMAFNDQLAALQEAGVPVVPSSGENDLARTLETVNSSVARRVSRGTSLADAVADDASIPAWYRCLALLGLRSGQIDSALMASNEVATTVDGARHAIKSAFFYPLVVFSVAYVGMIAFALFFVPMLEQTFDSLEIEPRLGLKILRAVRELLPYWVAIPPLLLLIYLLWQRYGASYSPFWNGRIGRALQWLTGTSRSITQARWASFAETLASLETSGMPLADAIPLAACACGDSNLVAACRAFAEDIRGQATLPADVSNPIAKRFPPFLRWAILSSDSTLGRARALEIASQVYRASADHLADRSRMVTPMIFCVVLGGGVTLLYSLALFVPVIDLINALSL